MVGRPHARCSDGSAGLQGALDAEVVAPEEGGGDAGLDGVRTPCVGHPKRLGTKHDDTGLLGVEVGGRACSPCCRCRCRPRRSSLAIPLIDRLGRWATVPASHPMHTAHSWRVIQTGRGQRGRQDFSYVVWLPEGDDTGSSAGAASRLAHGPRRLRPPQRHSLDPQRQPPGLSPGPVTCAWSPVFVPWSSGAATFTPSTHAPTAYDAAARPTPRPSHATSSSTTWSGARVLDVGTGSGASNLTRPRRMDER